ncbi:MAG: DUF421 domain-containing protein [Ruminococcaceae bacterium]|nr:DUF421 domain-containing protein [Oscillospiraceae bacterium]
MLVILVRTFILYILVILALRVMGKRQIGQLQPSELVVAMMLSELASIPMESIDVPILLGVIPVITLIIAETTFSFLTLKSRRVRKLLSGSPAILIEKGFVSEEEMRRLRFNIDDLMEELRTAGYANITDVEYAIIESNGALSVIPKSNKRPLTPADLNVSVAYEGVPFLLITDGIVNEKALQTSGHDISWLLEKLNEYNIHDFGDVFIATVDLSGAFFVQKKYSKKSDDK